MGLKTRARIYTQECDGCGTTILKITYGTEGLRELKRIWTKCTGCNKIKVIDI